MALMLTASPTTSTLEMGREPTYPMFHEVWDCPVVASPTDSLPSIGHFGAKIGTKRLLDLFQSKDMLCSW